jgi:tRNA(Ile)-lysidine synthase
MSVAETVRQLRARLVAAQLTIHNAQFPRPMSLAARVLETIRRHQMLPPGGRVIVALSGGPDSVALLHVLRELDAAGELGLAGLAHFNHQLRNEAADADEVFCRALAADVSLPLEVDRANVREIARAEGRSIEDAARRLRYLFLEAARVQLKADAIAVGHSRDDQAETFLLRLLRGAGTRGLGSIRPRAGHVIRPLLEVGRDELRHYAQEQRLRFHNDVTNLDVTIPRNRVRHELLPYLAREFSPRIAEVLAREAALAQVDDDRLQKEAIEIARSVVLVNTGSVTVDVVALSQVHPALASRVAMHALQQLSDRFVGFEHVSRFLAFVRDAREGQALSLPGQQAVRRGQTVVLGPEPLRGADPLANFLPVPLSVPGEVVVCGWSVAADLAGSVDVGAVGSLHTVALRGIVEPLSVRFRRPGDRFLPSGMHGSSKKLHDYFIDRKVERSERDRLPLVVDAEDRIVWVVGHGVAEGFRASAPSPGVILLKARRLGG